MTESFAGRTWKVLKRSASSLKRSTSGKSEDTPLPTISGRASQTNDKQTRIPQAANDPAKPAEQQPDSKASATSSRDEFLRDYDIATREIVRLIFGGDSTSAGVGDLPLQEVAPWNREPGFLGHLTDGQKQALQQMKTCFPESRQWHDDHDLLRFLRARDFDVKKTREMYSKYIREYRGRELTSPHPAVRPTVGCFETNLLELYPAREAGLTARMQNLVEVFLHTVAFGADKDGRPVVYFRPADIVKRNMTKHVPVAHRIAFQSAANEALFVLLKLASKRAGFHIESITQVLDLEGMSAMQMVSHMRSPGAQQEWQHNMDYMPELLYKVLVINAPAGMSMVFKVASYFLPAQTKRKVTILGSSYVAALDKAIGKENMPSCYGGKLQFAWQKHRPVGQNNS